MDVTGRADRAAAPAVGEQRPAPLAVDELGIGLGPDQPAAERRVDRRDQQSMIAPGQAAGDRAGGIAAAPVGEPPFAALGLLQIAADRPAEADELRTAGSRSDCCDFIMLLSPQAPDCRPYAAPAACGRVAE